MPKDKGVKSRSDKQNVADPQLSHFCPIACVQSTNEHYLTLQLLLSCCNLYVCVSARWQVNAEVTTQTDTTGHRNLSSINQSLAVSELHQSSRCKQLRHAGGLNWTPGYWLNKTQLLSVLYDVTLDICRSVASSPNYVSNYPTCLCLLSFFLSRRLILYACERVFIAYLECWASAPVSVLLLWLCTGFWRCARRWPRTGRGWSPERLSYFHLETEKFRCVFFQLLI